MGVIKDIIRIFKKNDKDNIEIDNLNENERKYGIVTAKLIDISERRTSNYEEYIKKAPQNLNIDKSTIDAVKRYRNKNKGYYFVEERKSSNEGLNCGTQNKAQDGQFKVDEPAFSFKDSIAYEQFRNNKWDSPIAYDTDVVDQMIREQEHERIKYADVTWDTDADRAIDQYHKDVFEDPLEFNRAMDIYNNCNNNDDYNDF